ncbi:ABC transporter permease [Mesorhizobium sp. B2-5-13]|uniref:ABC transporter permease n=1 Tax=unclassified Mesorhizobium TaxID=325217 RepID=UPI00112AD0EB|nr:MULTISPECIES: ABC transporter permease [unclassified Mesorhizobium]TPJ83354.1 ABC transporter permease [Mesorhizobium sp. B2-5-13]TPK44397.1 ABC transporter permease [Mesorhizobium sp. B2-5-5]TPL96902.1 ABC transporter permease [Mesorhizobium sp. B2-3-11]
MQAFLRRAGTYCIALVIAIAVNFVLPRLMPGSPVDSMIAQLGQRATPEVVAALRARFGQIDQPLWVQFGSYLKGLATFDLGVSTNYYPMTVLDVLARPLIWTSFLITTTVVFSFAMGTVLGAMSAWRRGGKTDSILSPLAFVVNAVPPVVFALTTLFVFGVLYRLAPVSYAYDPNLDPGLNATFLLSVAAHAALPVLSLAPYLIASFQSTMRSSMISVLNEDYVTLGRAKGLSNAAVMYSYGVRNAMLPMLTHLALMLGAIFGGSIVVEVVFNYPGLGLTLFTATLAHDYPVIQGQLMLMTVITLGANLLVDIIYGLVDPRLKGASR